MWCAIKSSKTTSPILYRARLALLCLLRLIGSDMYKKVNKLYKYEGVEKAGKMKTTDVLHCITVDIIANNF